MHSNYKIVRNNALAFYKENENIIAVIKYNKKVIINL